ncbi:MAG: prepilin-type N-terminal cleavage/methylation domain-containing protein [Desulfobacterales bacterium]|nr:prepilin-type N-terminal cleavage/methylation domain-containing protein [Desulfobacterales bacterium]
MNNEKGFTLIEIIVSLILIGILAAATSLGIGSSIQGYMFNVENVRIVQKAENIILRLNRELSEVTALDSSIDGSKGYIRYALGGESPLYKVINIAANDLQLRENASANCTNSTCTARILLDKVSSFAVQYEYPNPSVKWNDYPPADFSTLLRIKATVKLTRYDGIDKLNEYEIVISPRNNGMLNGPR